MKERESYTQVIFEPISDMNEENPRIIFEPLWMIKRELVWIPMFGYILFMAFYASIYLHLRHRESIKN